MAKIQLQQPEIREKSFDELTRSICVRSVGRLGQFLLPELVKDFLVLNNKTHFDWLVWELLVLMRNTLELLPTDKARLS